MADLGKDGEQDEKQKGDGSDFFGSAREGASCSTENAQKAQQPNRLQEEEEKAQTQKRPQHLRGREGGGGNAPSYRVLSNFVSAKEIYFLNLQRLIYNSNLLSTRQTFG